MKNRKETDWYKKKRAKKRAENITKEVIRNEFFIAYGKSKKEDNNNIVVGSGATSHIVTMENIW